MKNIKNVTGTFDYYGKSLFLKKYINKIAEEIFYIFGYSEIHTPILEYLSVFKQSAGLSSDIVNKELYIIANTSKLICLRPENTASVIRAIFNNGIVNKPLNKNVIKLFYTGDMFRRERPQQGRFRQFNQIGAEVIGIEDSLADIEIISLVFLILNKLMIKNIIMHINYLGDNKEREKYKFFLFLFFKKKKIIFCKDCKVRVMKNILRILDCKKKQCIKNIKNIPLINEFLTIRSNNKFNNIKNMLNILLIPYKVNFKLVRGLDYYDGIVFEFFIKDNYKNAIAAGGRYNSLTKLMYNQYMPATGFALGLERISTLIAGNIKNLEIPDLTIIHVSVKESFFVSNIVFNLRKIGIKTDWIIQSKTIKSQMRRAHKIKSLFVCIIGSNEILTQIVEIKNMNTKCSKNIILKSIDIANYINKKYILK